MLLQKKKIVRGVFLSLVMLGWAGCHKSVESEYKNLSPQQKLIVQLKKLPTVKSVEIWPLPVFIQDNTEDGLKISTNHYEIYTTPKDPLILSLLPVFLESAYRSYIDVLGHTIETSHKLQVYYFQSREQWEDFTRYWTGALSESFLNIKAGAYYYNKACIAYNISRQSTFSIMAHEGWHQFSNELFKFHLPAWLDEGLATNFEAYKREPGKVIFDARFNYSRLFSLKKTLMQDEMFTIADLLMLDAGHVVNYAAHNSHDSSSNPKVEAYYAQLYALTRFLCEYNYGQYLLAMRAMLEDAYTGQWPLNQRLQAEAIQRQNNLTQKWNSIVGPLIFQEYIAPDTYALESEYRSFCVRLVGNIRFKKQM